MQHFTLIAIKQISRWMPFLKIRLTVWFVASKNVNAVEVQDELQKNKNLWLFSSIKVLPRHCRISLVNLTYWQLMIYYKTTTNWEKMSKISLEKMVFVSLMIKRSVIRTILKLLKCCILQVGFVATFIKGKLYWYHFDYLLHLMNILLYAIQFNLYTGY